MHLLDSVDKVHRGLSEPVGRRKEPHDPVDEGIACNLPLGVGHVAAVTSSLRVGKQEVWILLDLFLRE